MACDESYETFDDFDDLYTDDEEDDSLGDLINEEIERHMEAYW